MKHNKKKDIESRFKERQYNSKNYFFDYIILKQDYYYYHIYKITDPINLISLQSLF